jgi:hypothetical protein
MVVDDEGISWIAFGSLELALKEELERCEEPNANTAISRFRVVGKWCACANAVVWIECFRVDNYS